MAIELIITVANPPDVDPPDPDPDPDPGDPPATTDFIDDAATLALRSAMVAAHELDTDPDYIGFTGISDTTGFTATTVTTADELRTALALLSTTATTKKVITCNWNGTQSWAGANTISGPSASGLTAYVNGAADIGYDTPPHYTKIVAGEGYSPVLGGSDGGTGTKSMTLAGFGYVEIDGIGFEKAVYVSRTSTRPILPIVAIRNCTFNGILYQSDARVNHIENNVFDGAVTGVRLGSQYCRFWGNEIKNKNRNADFSTFTGFNKPHQTGWDAHLWYAGNILHSCDDTTPSANHYDWLQYGVGTELVNSMNMLVEFNISNNNMEGGSQGFFGDDSGDYEVNACVHNNIITVNGYWGLAIKDPAGTGEINVYRNHVLRATGKTIDENTAARIAITDITAQAGPTTGVYDVRENYANSYLVQTAMSANATVEDNLTIVNSAGTNYVADVFTGNGTWAVGAYGATYDDPGFGLSRSAAFDAIRDFFLPIGGYRVDGYGCVDPDTWPTPGAAWS